MPKQATFDYKRVLNDWGITTSEDCRMIVRGYQLVRTFIDGANSEIVPDPELLLVAQSAAHKLFVDCPTWQRYIARHRPVRRTKNL